MWKAALRHGDEDEGKGLQRRKWTEWFDCIVLKEGIDLHILQLLAGAHQRQQSSSTPSSTAERMGILNGVMSREEDAKDLKSQCKLMLDLAGTSADEGSTVCMPSCTKYTVVSTSTI